MSIAERIEKLRISRGFSQAEIASKLGISRLTYIKMEKDDSNMSVNQLLTLADIFGVNVEEILYETQNTDKFKQMYIYFLTKFENGVPKTKLAKLLYLADFRHFYENLESMSGVVYKCQKYGPLADSFLQITDEMVESGQISITYLPGGANMIKSEMYKPNFDLLTSSDKKELDELYKLWKDIKTEVIVNYTREQKPWMACRENEVIPYALILQEDKEHVYKPVK